MPNQTVVLAPLTSLYDKDGNKKDYPNLNNDSYVKLDQIMTFSRNKIGNYICSLNEVDKASLHIKIIESLQMQDTIREIVFKQIERTVQELIEKYVEDVITKDL